MSELDLPEAALTGGCQCGAVRFRTTMQPTDVSYCHCRMCQRALGNLFATLAMFDQDRVEWTKGEPAVFASSSISRILAELEPFTGSPLYFYELSDPNRSDGVF